MISQSTYQAANSVAQTIENHFADQLLAARMRGELQLAPEPDSVTIEAMIDTAFWASLRKEEGRSPKISLAFLPPADGGEPLIFEKSLPLTPETLVKLAPAVERSGIHLGVWYQGSELHVWGTTRHIPGFCFVLEVVEPGLLVIKHRRTEGFGKFVNVAVLKGDQVKIIDENSITLPDCPALLSSLLGFSTPSTWHDTVNVHVQLAVSMRAHNRGGSLLVVPSANDNWRESIIHPINYPVTPVYTGLADLMRQNPINREFSPWKDELTKAVDSIAGLTAVDGATLINDQCELLAFGAKIGRSAKGGRVDEMLVTEPIIGNEPVIIHPGKEGGTRHLSAAQFVYDQRDAIALIASQDGRFTIFSWSPCEGMVHAHRVDVLLL